MKDSLFIADLVLYRAEGSKKTPSFKFVNSDPEIIKIMLEWIVAYMGVSKENIGFRLYIHRVYADENCEKYWSETIGVPAENFKKTIYKPTPHTIKRDPKFKGCLRLEVPKIENYRKVMAWQRLFSEYIFGGAPVA